MKTNLLRVGTNLSGGRDEICRREFSSLERAICDATMPGRNHHKVHHASIVTSATVHVGTPSPEGLQWSSAPFPMAKPMSAADVARRVFHPRRGVPGAWKLELIVESRGAAPAPTIFISALHIH